MEQIQYGLVFYITRSIEEISLWLLGKEQVEGSFETSSICEVNPGRAIFQGRGHRFGDRMGWELGSGEWGGVSQKGADMLADLL